MYFRLFQSNILCTLTFVRTAHHNMLKMNIPVGTAYFHLPNNTDTFQVTFQYENQDLKIKRQFNFNRKITETVDTFLGRVASSLDKIAQRKQKKKTDNGQETNSDTQIDVSVLRNGVQVPGNLICNDIFFKNISSHPIVLRMIGLDYPIVINSPWVTKLSLPNKFMVGFPVYPNKLESVFVDVNESEFTWMTDKSETVVSPNGKKKTVVSWEVVGNKPIYIPTAKDIGKKLKLKCIPKSNKKIGPEVEIESDSVVENGPGVCPFEKRHTLANRLLPPGRFRVLSYNILADLYAETDVALAELFSYCPRHALKIDYRKQLFVKEILGYNADIVCLQEVDTKIFETDLTFVLQLKGCEGIFTKKLSAGEGVACFYNTKRFKLLESHNIVLGEVLKTEPYCSHIWNKIHDNKTLVTRIGELGTSAQAIVLECLDKRGEILIIGNTHLYFHPDADHIRLLQGGLIIAFLQHLYDNISNKYRNSHVSIISCGDFNSVPECGIYKLMTTKFVPEDFPDWKSKEDEAVTGLTLSQPFSIASACGTPKYTNYTVGFADCLDYIYYQTDRLLVEQVVPLPSEEELKRHIAIPSIVFPSDHIALVADLKWK